MSACRASSVSHATAIRLARAIVAFALLGASGSGDGALAVDARPAEAQAVGAAGQQGMVASAPEPTVADRAPAATDAAELLFWETIKDSSNPAEYRAYLDQYPSGVFRALARIRAEPAGSSDLSGSQAEIAVEAPRAEAVTLSEPEGSSTEKSAEGAPGFEVGDHVEALSAQGWAAATIVDQDVRGVRVTYDDNALPDEQLDVRLLRPAVTQAAQSGEVELVEPTGASAAGPDGASGTGLEAATRQVAPGTYGCIIEFGAFQSGAAAIRPDAAGYDITILTDGRYQAFSEDEGRYAYDPTGQIVSWETGVFSGVETRYEKSGAGSRLILTQFPAPGTSTCTRK